VGPHANIMTVQPSTGVCITRNDTGHVWKGIRGTARELRRCIPSSFGEPLDGCVHAGPSSTESTPCFSYIIMTPKASTVAADLIRIYSVLKAFRKRHSNAQPHHRPSKCPADCLRPNSLRVPTAISASVAPYPYWSWLCTTCPLLDTGPSSVTTLKALDADAQTMHEAHAHGEAHLTPTPVRRDEDPRRSQRRRDDRMEGAHAAQGG
jgi:hypothetical protein